MSATLEQQVARSKVNSCIARAKAARDEADSERKKYNLRTLSMAELEALRLKDDFAWKEYLWRNADVVSSRWRADAADEELKRAQDEEKQINE